MKILVLMQDGNPIEAFNLPKTSRDWEVEQFATKIREAKYQTLKAAFLLLNPLKEEKKVGIDDLPTLATCIVELGNFGGQNENPST